MSTRMRQLADEKIRQDMGAKRPPGGSRPRRRLQGLDHFLVVIIRPRRVYSLPGALPAFILAGVPGGSCTPSSDGE
jgi:hypothetical protein